MQLFRELRYKTTPDEATKMVNLAKANQWDQIKVPEQDPCLRLAVSTKIVGLLEAILQENYDLALRRAVFSQQKALTLILLPKVKNLNAKSGAQTKNRTALHFAVLWGNSDVLTALLQQGAYVNANDDDGNTPVHLACQKHDLATARILFRAGGSIPTNRAGQTPVQLLPENLMSRDPSFQFELMAIGVSNAMKPHLNQSMHAWLIDSEKTHTCFKWIPQWQHRDLREQITQERECLFNLLDKFKIKHLTMKELITLEKEYYSETSFHDLITDLAQAPEVTIVTDAQSSEVLERILSIVHALLKLQTILGVAFNLIVKSDGVQFFIVSKQSLAEEKFKMIPENLVTRSKAGHLLVEEKHFPQLVETLQVPLAAKNQAPAL